MASGSRFAPHLPTCVDAFFNVQPQDRLGIQLQQLHQQLMLSESRDYPKPLEEVARARLQSNPLDETAHLTLALLNLCYWKDRLNDPIAASEHLDEINRINLSNKYVLGLLVEALQMEPRLTWAEKAERIERLLSQYPANDWHIVLLRAYVTYSTPPTIAVSQEPDRLIFEITSYEDAAYKQLYEYTENEGLWPPEIRAFMAYLLIAHPNIQRELTDTKSASELLESLIPYDPVSKACMGAKRLSEGSIENARRFFKDAILTSFRDELATCAIVHGILRKVPQELFQKIFL